MNVKNLSDEALVVWVRTKNQELYAELVKRYQKKLWRYAQFLVGGHEEAKDVVQEAFIKAFVNLRGFNIKKKFSSWLYRIVHNEAINFLKKKRPKMSLEANGWLKEKLEDDTDVEADLEKKEVRKMVGRGLKKLPVGYRAPLVLFYWQDQSYEEIAEVLHLPVGTVGTRINRGKKLLKVILQKNGFPKN